MRNSSSTSVPSQRTNACGKRRTTETSLHPPSSSPLLRGAEGSTRSDRAKKRVRVSSPIRSSSSLSVTVSIASRVAQASSRSQRRSASKRSSTAATDSTSADGISSASRPLRRSSPSSHSISVDSETTTPSPPKKRARVSSSPAVTPAPRADSTSFPRPRSNSPALLPRFQSASTASSSSSARPTNRTSQGCDISRAERFAEEDIENINPRNHQKRSKLPNSEEKSQIEAPPQRSLSQLVTEIRRLVARRQHLSSTQRAHLLDLQNQYQRQLRTPRGLSVSSSSTDGSRPLQDEDERPLTHEEKPLIRSQQQQSSHPVAQPLPQQGPMMRCRPPQQRLQPLQTPQHHVAPLSHHRQPSQQSKASTSHHQSRQQPCSQPSQPHHQQPPCQQPHRQPPQRPTVLPPQKQQQPHPRVLVRVDNWWVVFTGRRPTPRTAEFKIRCAKCSYELDANIEVYYAWCAFVTLFLREVLF